MAAALRSLIMKRFEENDSLSQNMSNVEQEPADNDKFDFREGDLVGDEENTKMIRYREHWNAKPPITDLKPMTKPVHNVIITYTGTAPCEGVESCDKAVRYLQDHYQLSVGLPDIPFSFLVTKDGNVYEARGWDYRPFVPKKSFPKLRGSRLVIAQINSDFDDAINPPCDDAIWDLLQHGLENEFIHQNAHKITSSPWV